MTVEELATELGIDLATAKPEGLAKVRTHLTDVDTKYKSATELQQAADANLRKVHEEQDRINEYIAQYGTSETTNAALRANNAAMEAQLKSLKEQGLSVTIPDPIATPTAPRTAAPAFDPEKLTTNLGNLISQGFNLNNKHQTLYGRPVPDDIEQLAAKARAAGKNLYDYAAEKYDFAGEESRKQAASQKAHDEKIAADAVKAYQEKNPNVTGNPFVAGGGESAHPQIFKPRSSQDLASFANLNPRQKLAASVQRTREAVAANQ